MTKAIAKTLITAQSMQLILVVAACALPWVSEEEAPIEYEHGLGLLIPSTGMLYHGVFPGDASVEAEEDGVTIATVESYEQTVGCKVAWVYFSHNWYSGRQFPIDTATWIRDRGAVPFIRLMLRSSSEQDVREPFYSIKAIAAGDFDEDLLSWGREAASFGTPLIVEWGTEVNGQWFAWNGRWNGRSLGPERFRAAFRHIVRTISSTGAANITWVFHVDVQDVPEVSWNMFENYYPGDDAVDWLGISNYGALSPDDDEWPYFSAAMDSVVPRLTSLAPDKPVFVLEFGATMGNSLGDAADWADAALTDLLSNRWPEVRGFSWWNEAWENDDNPANDTNLRVQDIPGMAEVFRKHLTSSNIVVSPIIP